MPCWTQREISVDIDSGGMNLARLAEAASEFEANVSTQNGKTIVSAPTNIVVRHGGRPNLVNKIKQRYSVLTIEEGSRKFAFKVRSQSVLADGRSIQITAGR